MQEQHPMRKYLSSSCFTKYILAIKNLEKKMNALAEAEADKNKRR